MSHVPIVNTKSTPLPLRRPVSASVVIGSSVMVGTRHEQTNPQIVLSQAEKCRDFFIKIIEISHKRSEEVQKEIKLLIQKLIDAIIVPEEFGAGLLRLMNASPAQNTIQFLKKSLPLLRQQLATKQLVITGIIPPLKNVPVEIQVQQPISATRTTARPIKHIPPNKRITIISNILITPGRTTGETDENAAMPSSNPIDTKAQSCNGNPLLNLPLQRRVRSIFVKHKLDEPTGENGPPRKEPRFRGRN